MSGTCNNCVRLRQAGVSIDPCPGNTCRRCPWRACRCTHEAPCDRGFIEAEHLTEGYEIALRRCPVCGIASFETGQSKWQAAS